ncbi:MAG: Dabb family protein [Pseudomonadota bacterium]
MIRHIVLFSLKNREDMPRVVRILEGYRAIPQVRSLEVGVNQKLDTLSNEFDVALTVSFETVDDLEAYKQHAIYKAGTEVIRPLRDQRVVADYEIG